jgi:glucokinase
VDVGGTKIAAGLVDQRGRVAACRRTQTAPEGGTRVVSQITDLLRQLLEDAAAPQDALSAIGIAVPAVIDQKRGLVLWAPNVPGWQCEVTVTRPIAEAFEVPVSLHYDGHAWVTGEWWRGAARGARDVALLAIGTGIGGGIILGGRLHRGRIGVAGAVGWWIVDRPQVELTRREGEGWLESVASGPAIAKASDKSTAEEAFQAAREGDTAAQEAVERAAAALGAATANLLSLLDPEVIVLAGGVMAGGADLLLPRICQIAAREAQPQIAGAGRIVSAELGEDAAWIGAARLALDSLTDQEDDN